MDNASEGQIPSSSIIPRDEGKEYLIAMIILQSYRYISFLPEVTKIKTCNSIRMFCKRFEKELFLYLNQVVK